METTKPKMSFVADKDNNKIVVTRMFAADRDKVWRAWTEKDLLEQWWAPKPWRAITKSFDFREGGHWLYYMAGPEGEQHWARMDYQTINKPSSLHALDTFCDEESVPNPELPPYPWHVSFSSVGSYTEALVVLQFSSVEHMEAMLEFGFEAGWTDALENLDVLLQNM